MAPPAWLVQKWKDEPDWVRRFIAGSYDLNAQLCGVDIDKTATMWKPTAIREFLAHMNKIKRITAGPMIVYRGTTVQSPTMHPASFLMTSCQFMSTSKSAAIAKEFAGKKGYIHEFRINKGVAYYDLEEIYGNDRVKREKEVLIYPGCRLQLIEFKKDRLVWELSPTDV